VEMPRLKSGCCSAAGYEPWVNSVSRLIRLIKRIRLIRLIRLSRLTRLSRVIWADNVIRAIRSEGVIWVIRLQASCEYCNSHESRPSHKAQ
jgi:hypothetical protein